MVPTIIVTLGREIGGGGGGEVWLGGGGGGGGQRLGIKGQRNGPIGIVASADGKGMTTETERRRAMRTRGEAEEGMAIFAKLFDDLLVSNMFVILDELLACKFIDSCPRAIWEMKMNLPQLVNYISKKRN